MTDTERDLLRAVLVAPGDDEPRLVYADHLDERGEHERAEFIRCQIAHAAIPLHECDSIYPGCMVFTGDATPRVSHDHKCRGYKPQQRYRELWGRHGKEWFGDDIRKDVVRGFPDRIECTMSQFMGGPCVTCSLLPCDGRTTVTMTFRGETLPVTMTCGNCVNGRTPGIAADVFGKWPILAVNVSDFRWRFMTDDSFQAFDMPGWDDDLMRAVYVAVAKGVEPEQAMSDAAVAYGRGLVWLRAFTPPATPPNSTS